MSQYIFILGNNPVLSKAEIKAVLGDFKVISQSDKYLVVESSNLDCQKVMSQLGGTIKIGEVMPEELNKNNLVKYLTELKQDGKLKFGFSFYDVKPDKRIGMEVKGLLKGKGISSRLVTSKEPNLSSVIVSKNKCHDFLILPDKWGVTSCVQDFKEYGKLDFGRPKSDAKSGMLPPKLAKIMINLSQAKKEDTILDPFCGSGTILMEAAVLGFTNLIGSDVSDKAVADTQQNLSWLKDNYDLNFKSQIFQTDIKDLDKNIESANVIVTEPYLGKPITGNERLGLIESNIENVRAVYISAFKQFKKVLTDNGKVVIVMPEWHINNQVLGLNLDNEIDKLNFILNNKDNLIYKREGQHVWRRIRVYVKK